MGLILQGANVVSHLASMDGNDVFGVLESTLGKWWGNDTSPDCMLVLVTASYARWEPLLIYQQPCTVPFHHNCFDAMDRVKYCSGADR